MCFSYETQNIGIFYDFYICRNPRTLAPWRRMVTYQCPYTAPGAVGGPFKARPRTAPGAARGPFKARLIQSCDGVLAPWINFLLRYLNLPQLPIRYYYVMLMMILVLTEVTQDLRRILSSMELQVVAIQTYVGEKQTNKERLPWGAKEFPCTICTSNAANVLSFK